MIEFPLASTDGQPGLQRFLGTDRSGRTEYLLNSHGYRSAEFGDFAGSLVTIGCSFTLGIGVAESDLWASRVSAALGLPLNNLAQGGVGVAWCRDQFVSMILAGHRPRAVALVWPTETRSLWLGRGGPEQPQQRQQYHQAHTQCDQHMIESATRARYSVRALCQSQGIVLAELTWSEHLADAWQIPLFPRVDLGTDLEHPGPQSHRLAHRLILAQFYQQGLKSPLNT